MIFPENFSIPEDYEQTCLVGIRLDPDNEECNFFTIFFIGEKDVPLTSEDYIVLFHKKDKLFEFVKARIPDIHDELNLPESEGIIDIARTLYLLEACDIDDSAIIVNSLNLVIDLVKASRLKMPDGYKSIIYKLADHFTFDRKIKTFFTDNSISKDKVIDVLLWCLGAVMSKSKFLN